MRNIQRKEGVEWKDICAARRTERIGKEKTVIEKSFINSENVAIEIYNNSAPPRFVGFDTGVCMLFHVVRNKGECTVTEQKCGP